LALALAGDFDAAADGPGCFALALVGELVVGDAGDFDMNVNAVEQGAGDALLVAGDVGGGLRGAFVLVVAPLRASRRGRGSNKTNKLCYRLRSDFDGIIGFEVISI
jgi:hypothetical protein